MGRAAAAIKAKPSSPRSRCGRGLAGDLSKESLFGNGSSSMWFERLQKRPINQGF
jgi:hypothetical protein